MSDEQWTAAPAWRPGTLLKLSRGNVWWLALVVSVDRNRRPVMGWRIFTPEDGKLSWLFADTLIWLRAEAIGEGEEGPGKAGDPG